MLMLIAANARAAVTNDLVAEQPRCQRGDYLQFVKLSDFANCLALLMTWGGGFLATVGRLKGHLRSTEADHDRTELNQILIKIQCVYTRRKRVWLALRLRRSMAGRVVRLFRVAIAQNLRGLRKWPEI